MKRTATGNSNRIGTPISALFGMRITTCSSRLAPEQSLRPDEDHHHEEQERDRVAPFGSKARAADRDEFRDDEGRDEAADHVAQPAEHADHEDQRAEMQAALR